VPQSRAPLANGDRIIIGKQSFTLVVEDVQDATGTQALSFTEPPLTAPCSVCDQPFDAVDRVRGWASGERRICRRCLSKGVKPENLANSVPVEPDPVVLEAPPTFLDGPVGPAAETDAELDVVDAGPRRPPSDEPTAGVTPPTDARPGESDRDRQRRQRRLSASRLAQVDAPAAGKPGLLSKVGSVFANREERRRLETLEEERRGLIEQAGRIALSEHNGFGVPEHLMGALLKGVAVNLRLQDLSIAAVERWRTLRQRVALLDAEIAALRTTLALGPDPTVVNPPEPLRADHLERQNRTFAALDAVGTEDLANEDANVDEVAIDPVPSPRPRPEPPRPRAEPARPRSEPAKPDSAPRLPERPAAASDRRRAVRRRR
jgi:hypothetical protein